VCSCLQTLLQHPTYGPLLADRTLKLLSDSRCAVADVNGMGGAPDVFPFVQRLWSLAAHHGVDLLAEWRPRETVLMQEADLHSKLLDAGDWGLSAAAYHDVCSAFACVPEVDWFASSWSAKCHVFCSRFLEPHCTFVDAFAFDWRLSHSRVSYVCPPHMLVSRVLAKLLLDRASCVLVLPAWWKVWSGQLSLLPVVAQYRLPGSVVEWGPRAPAVRCAALHAGLIAYLVRFL